MIEGIAQVIGAGLGHVSSPPGKLGQRAVREWENRARAQCLPGDVPRVPDRRESRPGYTDGTDEWGEFPEERGWKML